MLHYEDIKSFKDRVKKLSGTILGIDYGTKHTGIATTDRNATMAFAEETISTFDLVTYIDNFLSENQTKGIVFGWPKTGINEVHAHGRDILHHAQRLSLSTDVLLWDERMSTIGAVKNINFSYGHMNKNNKKQMRLQRDDHLAAQYILQQVVDILNAD